MNDYLVFALFLAAIAIGWCLGRYQRRRADSAPDIPGEYYRNFNYLLDGRRDGAVDAFIDSMEVNSETLETHIALGRLLRQRGEVERAIRIHQNLLARPSLPEDQVHRAHLELACDYVSAGLLDRAERLLLDLIAESPALRPVARRHLLEIYQSEREWTRAAEVARELLPRRRLARGNTAADDTGQAIPVVLAHYHCELAGERRDAGDLDGARRLLHKALRRDPQCVRASLALGEVECEAGRYRQAIDTLRRVRTQDADFIYETVPTLRECHRQLGEEGALRSYLRDCLRESPSPPLVLAVAEALREEEGNAAAAAFLSRQLESLPSLRGVEKLLLLHARGASGEQKSGLELLQSVVNRLLQQRPTYRCEHCGFAGRHLHWLCPGCRYWGTLRNIRGTSME